jgi:Flp pilus assembly protein TadD
VVSARLALADLQATIGKLEDARLSYGRLESMHPENADVLHALGQFAGRMEDFQGARQYLDRAIRSGRSSAEVFYDYAVVLRRLKEPEALVVENLTRAVTLDDRFFEGHSFLGYLHLQAERFAPAVRHLQRAAELQPARVSVWENLAVAHHKAGDKDNARAAAKAARRLASGPEEVARIDALLDLIESDADKIVLVPRENPPDAAASAPAALRVDGMLFQVDCLGKQARLHIAIPGGKILLLVRDAGAVRLHGTGSVETALACGPSAARPLLVEYRPEIHRTYGTAGIVISMEFR